MIGKSSQIDQLHALMNQSQTRHEVISSNIANVNTPQYATKDVQFSEVLSAVHGVHPDGQNAQVYKVEGLPVRQDGNNVDLDRELAHLTRNALAYQTYSQIMTSKLGTYRSAITGRS